MRRVAILLVMLGVGGCTSAVPERVQEYNQDGIFLFQQGDYRAACESFVAAADLQPENPGLLYNAGQCYDRLGDSSKAERYYRACLQKDANHADGRHALTALLVRSGRRDEASQEVQAWLAREPKRAAAYAEDGWLLHEAGDLPGAQARFQQALELDPHDLHALIELARTYETMQRPDRAAVLYERVLQIKPNHPEVVRRLNQLKASGIRAPQPE